ncbi:MAG TPA: EboA domain-containing protein [Paraburkholderia sp.]|nr:EboA domain-containing protein [Paraburkholderia sp.]
MNEITGCNFERWTLLEALRVALLLTSPDIGDEAFDTVFEHGFRFADHGESCALYRALPLLPRGERFVARAREGCRSNMRTIFEAVACDSPYPARHFDDVSWHQLAIKAVFVGAPLWRVHGLDNRLSPELARMALDFADERRSAGRAVPPQLWLCLGPHGGERGLQALQQALNEADEAAQRGALLGLARAGALSRGSDWQRAACDRHAGFIEHARAEGFAQQTLQLQ